MGADNNALLVLANYDFRDEEFKDTFQALKDAGIETKIAAMSNEDCKGVGGTLVSVDFTLDEVEAIQYGAIVFIGGIGIEDYLHDESVHALAKSFHESGKIIGAICWAPAILANAGILNGKRVTAWDGAKEDIVQSGATFTGEAISVDGTLITANGPDAASQFGMVIAKMIIGEI